MLTSRVEDLNYLFICLVCFKNELNNQVNYNYLFICLVCLLNKKTKKEIICLFVYIPMGINKKQISNRILIIIKPLMIEGKISSANKERQFK